MSNNSLSVYKAWAKSKNLPDELLSRIYQKADRSGNIELLSLIANRDNLPEEIENLIVSRSELEVIKSWVNRNIRDTDKIVTKVLADKRATLLLMVSSIANLPENLYVAFAKSTSKKVAYSLALNNSVSDDIIKSIEDLVISSISGDHSGTIHNTTNLIKARPFLLDNFVAKTKSNLGLVTVISNFDISEETALVAAKRVSEIDVSSVSYHFLSAFEKFIGKDHSSEVLLALKPLADQSGTHSDYYSRKVVESANTAIARVGYDTASVYSRLKNDSYIDLSATIKEAKLAIADKKLNANLVARYIWENNNSSNAMMLDVVYSTPKDVILNRLLEMEKAGDLDRIIELFDERVSNYVNVDAMLNPLPIVERAAQRPGEVNTWVKYSKAWAHDRELALKYQPAIISLTDTGSCDKARELVSSQLDTDTQWETFDGLVAEFSGSVIELLDTVKALNA